MADAPCGRAEWAALLLPLLPWATWGGAQAAAVGHLRGKTMERRGQVPGRKWVAQGKEGGGAGGPEPGDEGLRSFEDSERQSQTQGAGLLTALSDPIHPRPDICRPVSTHPVKQRSGRQPGAGDGRGQGSPRSGPGLEPLDQPLPIAGPWFPGGNMRGGQKTSQGPPAPPFHDSWWVWCTASLHPAVPLCQLKGSKFLQMG